MHTLQALSQTTLDEPDFSTCPVCEAGGETSPLHPVYDNTGFWDNPQYEVVAEQCPNCGYID